MNFNIDLKSIDLKNISLEDIQAKLKNVEKKTWIKIGSIAGAVVLFLIIFYGVLNPIVEKKKVQLDDMNLKIKEVLKSVALAKADGKKVKAKKTQTKNVKNIAYYLIPVDFEIDGNFIGYIKFKRALSLSNKMLNFDKESIQVVKGDTTGAIKVRGSLTIVGLPNEFF